MTQKHTIAPARFGWGWEEADDGSGDQWIEVALLDDAGYREEEVCVLMLRSAAEFEHLRGQREHRANLVVEALNDYAAKHGLAPGFLGLGGTAPHA